MSTAPGAASLWRTAGVSGDAERRFDLEPMPTSQVGYWAQGTRALASSDTHLYFPLYTPATLPVPPRPSPLLLFIEQAQLSLVYAPSRR